MQRLDHTEKNARVDKEIKECTCVRKEYYKSTAISRKVVLQTWKSLHDNVENYYG